MGLIRHLHRRNIIVLKQEVKEEGELAIKWLTMEYLQLFGDWALEWEAYYQFNYVWH